MTSTTIVCASMLLQYMTRSIRQMATWKQISCDCFWNERNLSSTTNYCTHSICQERFSWQLIHTPAINYGRKHETVAISSYVEHNRSKEKFVQIHSCRLFVDHSKPWLATSLDGIVTDFSEIYHSKGIIEVKGPYGCDRQTINYTCKTVNGLFNWINITSDAI